MKTAKKIIVDITIVIAGILQVAIIVYFVCTFFLFIYSMKEEVRIWDGNGYDNFCDWKNNLYVNCSDDGYCSKCSAWSSEISGRKELDLILEKSKGDKPSDREVIEWIDSEIERVGKNIEKLKTDNKYINRGRMYEDGLKRLQSIKHILSV